MWHAKDAPCGEHGKGCPGIQKVHVRSVPKVNGSDGGPFEKLKDAMCSEYSGKGVLGNLDIHCSSALWRGRKHVLAQSYFDEVLSGLMQFGKRTNVAQVDGEQIQVCGGRSVYDKKTMRRMKKWMKTTEILSADVTYSGTVDEHKPKVWFVNDRQCPRSPNPIWVNKENEVGGAYGHSGVTSSGSNTTRVYELIDSVMDEFIHNDKDEPQKVSQFRKVLSSSKDGACEAIGFIPHFTDVLEGFESIWDRARDIAVMQITAQNTFQKVQTLISDAQSPGMAEKPKAANVTGGDAEEEALEAGEEAKGTEQSLV